jgi:23S rRNA pseudouridine1911/1915/1917 synthase
MIETRTFKLPGTNAVVVFQDDNIVAMNKPAGMLTIPDRHDAEISSLSKELEKYYGKIFIVHRLDKDTSGLIVFAKNEAAHKQLSLLFQGRDVDKYYQGLVLGKFTQPTGAVEEPITEHPVRKGVMAVHRSGKPSTTVYEVLEDLGIMSLVQFRILTGRTHQIRVHMKHIGHPLVCDDVYGDGKPILLSSFKKKFKLSAAEEEERPMLNRLALHSARLLFTLDGKQYDLSAELPKDMRALLNQLRKHKH